MTNPKLPLPPLKTFLRPEFHSEYENWKSTIFEQLVNINQALFFLEKVESFPFDLLQVPYEHRAFWFFQYNFLVDYSILAIQRLITEDSNPTNPNRQMLTLPQFREALKGNFVDANAEARLDQQVDAVNFDVEIALIRENVNKVRNKYVAHLDRQKHVAPTKGAKLFTSLSELKEALRLGVELFNALDFDVTSDFYDRVYKEEKRRNKDTDIDYLLRATGVSGKIVQLSPKNIQMLALSMGITRQGIIAINEIRAWCGKPLIPLDDFPEGQ